MIRPLAVGALLGLIAGCRTDSSAFPAAGAEPTHGYAIGPQPGTDRPMAFLVNPYRGDRQALVEGRRLFNWYNCSGCHGDHGGGGMGPSLRDSLWYYGGDEASIFASITEGRQHGMPAWGTKVPRDQIWQIVAYLKSMRTDNEPDPSR